MDRPKRSRIESALWAVVQRRCPQCGRGPAFDGWWRLKPACPVCGRRFQQHPGTTTGVMQVGAMAVVIFAIIAWFPIAALSHGSLDQSLIILIVVSTVFGLWFYPYAKLVWEAVDYLLDQYNE